MKKRNIWIAVLALLIAGGAYGATLAFFTDAKEQDNVFVMGNVKIVLSEPKFEKATDGTYAIKNVMPNQPIVKDPQITVGADSEDAYLRVKLDYVGLNAQESQELEAGITFKNGWYKGTDGYFYYNEIAQKKDVVVVFDTLRIPSKWGNEITNREFKLNVSAEAVQAANFTPKTNTVEGVQYVSGWFNDDGSPIVVK